MDELPAAWRYTTSVVNGWEIQTKAQLGKLTFAKPLQEFCQQGQGTDHPVLSLGGVLW
jgi:PIN domain nuclease of toxin-antitoxin system